MATRLDGYPDLVAAPDPDASRTPRRRIRPRACRSVAVGLTLVGGSLMAGCAAGAQSGRSPAQVEAWMSSSGDGAAIGQVKVDSRNIDLTLHDHDPSSAVKAACALLSTDALTAIGNLPSPDATLTDDLNTAFETGSAAGRDCYNGSAGNASLLRRSARERAGLVGLLAVAATRFAVVTGHPPSTSTTEAPNVSPDPFGN